MPQASPAYAVGRVRVLENTLLGHSQLERLALTQSVEELARALGENNWGEVRTRGDIEKMCDAHMREAAKLVRDCSSDPDLTDCFLIQYDALNLKALYKARALGEARVALSGLGLLDPEGLRRMVEENNYQDLPAELREAMQDIDRRSAVKMDPLYVDARLDKAVFSFIENRMATCKEETIRLYFICRAELINLMIALRSGAMGRGAAFARELFVTGGTLSCDGLSKVAEEPDRAYDLIRYRPYAYALSAPVKALDRNAIERAGEDYLLGLLRPHRYEPTSILPLVGYLLARTRESQAVRLLATAKATGVSQEKLSSCLRALY